MGIIAHARMGPTGWTRSAAEKADGLMADLFATDSDQSNLFVDSISSLPAVVAKYNPDPNLLCRNLNNMLERYLSRYYPDGVVVDVFSDATNPQFVGTTYVVSIKMVVTEGTDQFSLGYLVDVSDGVAKKIARINNTGA